MSESFEKELSQFKPRSAPPAWKAEILSATHVLDEVQEDAGWWEMLRIPRPLQWGLACVWILILILKGTTPEVGHLSSRWHQMTLADLRDYQSRIRMAAQGNLTSFTLTEQGAHFEIKLYEN